MKKIESTGHYDQGGGGPFSRPRYLPETPFEEAILQQVIGAHVRDGAFKIAAGYNPLTLEDARVGFSADSQWSSDGWFEGYVEVENGPFDLSDADTLPDVAPIFFCVEENEYPASEFFRVKVCWRMPASEFGGEQCGEMPNFPVLQEA